VGQWRVASPITRCTENDVDGAELCHITKGRQRVRKVGPVHPLWLFKCLAHKCWFLYASKFCDTNSDNLVK
jgi:hypothetical protein